MNIKKLKLVFKIGFSLLVLSGCVTHPHRLVQKVTPGMEKSDLIELLGSPQKTFRVDGQDRWMYVYYLNGKRAASEVVIEGGTVKAVNKANIDKTLMDQLWETKNMESYQKKVLEHRKSTDKLKDIE